MTEYFRGSFVALEESSTDSSNNETDDFTDKEINPKGKCYPGKIKKTPGRKKKPPLSTKEKTEQRLESNERERNRMHSLNQAFQVSLTSQNPQVTLLITMVNNFFVKFNGLSYLPNFGSHLKLIKHLKFIKQIF